MAATRIGRSQQPHVGTLSPQPETIAKLLITRHSLKYSTYICSFNGLRGDKGTEKHYQVICQMSHNQEVTDLELQTQAVTSYFKLLLLLSKTSQRDKG